MATTEILRRIVLAIDGACAVDLEWHCTQTGFIGSFNTKWPHAS